MKAIFSNDRFGINRKDFLLKSIPCLLLSVRLWMESKNELENSCRKCDETDKKSCQKCDKCS